MWELIRIANLVLVWTFLVPMVLLAFVGFMFNDFSTLKLLPLWSYAVWVVLVGIEVSLGWRIRKKN